VLDLYAISRWIGAVASGGRWGHVDRVKVDLSRGVGDIGLSVESSRRFVSWCVFLFAWTS
jgi:hypothetical protein